MDNQPHVRLVDSHPESIRGDHYAALVIFPTVLPDRLFFPVQSGMKEIGRYSGLLQEESCLFCLFPAPGIDDSRAGHFSEYVGQCAQLVFRTAHDVGKVRTDKACPEHILLLEKQSSLYVVHDFGRGSRRQCQYRHAGQLLPNVGDMEIGRAEVIAPLRDTMAFIHH